MPGLYQIIVDSRILKTIEVTTSITVLLEIYAAFHSVTVRVIVPALFTRLPDCVVA